MNRDYSDIIDMEHHISKKHAQMSIYDRAAQFAPFAALTGHGKAIEEVTEEHMEEIIKQEKNEVFYE